MLASSFAGSWRRLSFIAVVLVCAAGIAWRGAEEDSVTVDEPSHLVAGYTSLLLRDFRLSPDHPPLGRMVLALPLLVQSVAWRAEGSEAWRSGDFFSLGRRLFEEWNDGQRLVRSSRAVAVAGLLALLLTIGAIARSLFGAWGGAFAMAVAAFDPGLLSHGHLATLDVPFTLCALLTLLSAHRWFAHPVPSRLAILAATFAISTLVKFSWFALVPALVVMAASARRTVPAFAAPRFRRMVTAASVTALTSFLGIWAAYGFRFSAARGDDAATATMHVLADIGRDLPQTPESAWESVLHDPVTARDRSGPAVSALRTARRFHLLPEAYLYGVAYVAKKAEGRAAYLRGRYSRDEFYSYFLWALVVKTPLPTLVLMGASLVAAAVRWSRNGWPSPLAAGLTTFALVYLLVLTSSGLNLGYRHLLPVTAVHFVTIGGLFPGRVTSAVNRSAVVVLASAVVGLGIGTWRASPHLLGYFNEAVGGWPRGHLYLADSNIDWGQDLLRLRERLSSESPKTTVWLAQAGGPPLPRGLAVSRLLLEGDVPATPGSIAGGLYVISATDLLGVYRPLARTSSWRDPRLIDRFEAMAAEQHARGDAPASSSTFEPFEALRRLRLIARLAQRDPDERIGTSLFLFRLGDEQVRAATEP